MILIRTAERKIGTFESGSRRGRGKETERYSSSQTGGISVCIRQLCSEYLHVFCVKVKDQLVMDTLDQIAIQRAEQARLAAARLTQSKHRAACLSLL